jgi:exodeoxyribonuclease V alpha subunit
MTSVAIAAPTGKAAQRLQESIGSGLALAARDIADAALARLAPTPQTLHRLLGWSPSAGRFARHENDPLPHRFVVVDEASMVDLYLMDRLVRALPREGHLVLLGDADQLPSIEAGAVFRDLCASLGAARLTVNLRVSRDPSGRGIVDLARAVNSGSLDGVTQALGTKRSAPSAVVFEGVEHLGAAWEVVGDALVDRWWQAQVPRLEPLAGALSRTHRLVAGELDDEARASLDALLAHHQRSRFLCATRAKAVPTSAESINRNILARWRSAMSRVGRWSSSSGLCPGVPVLVERNDYERGLYNGDVGIVLRADAGDGGLLYAAFKRRGAWTAFPLESLGELAPSFAMTVHKAQGSEHDEVVVVLPETDLPMLTREWLYTAFTRARRSVLLVGSPDLLECAVSRRVERYSAIARKLVDLAG